MKGDKKTFIEGKYFYKEYSKNEYYFLRMLHSEYDLPIDTIMKNGIQYIEMPKGNIISVDTIPAKKRNTDCIRNIIIKNIPFMLQQVIKLNAMGIYYSDCMQWLYYNNRLYLIDFDIAFTSKIDYDYNNHNLLVNFLASFNIDSSYITESLHYLELFKTTDIEWTLYNNKDKTLYKQLNDVTMQKNHVYYCRNQRHIQIDIKNIHVYGNSGNMIITENILNPETAREWELIKIA